MILRLDRQHVTLHFVKGGRDNLVEWAKATFPEDKNIIDEVKEPSLFEVFVDTTPGTAQKQTSSA